MPITRLCQIRRIFGQARRRAVFGRLTAPLCFAGACAAVSRTLRRSYRAHIERIGDVADLRFDPLNISVEFLENLALKDFPVIDDVKGGQMKAVIEAAREELDSVGGAVEWRRSDCLPGSVSRDITELKAPLPG